MSTFTKLNFLDCTLRDGGYYNNWDFSKKNIQTYLNNLSKTHIKYVELGFRFFEKNYPMGLTAFTKDELIDSLDIPNNLLIGVMVNAAELKKNNLNPLKNLKKLFLKIHPKLSFVRFACHFEEIFKLTKCIRWLKKNKIRVFINIMQISEIREIEIKKISIFLKKNKVEDVCLADSLGALKKNSLRLIIKRFKKYGKFNLGLHAHNNLNLALENSILAIKNDFKWIDSTVSGMGRGPGNLKTEDILLKFYKEDLFFINKLKKSFFDNLQKKFKWGPNKYYKFAAENKVHPTYIQQMLSDERFNTKEYKKILSNLKNIDARKYEHNNLLLIKKTKKISNINSWVPKTILDQKEVLIIGPAKSVKNSKNKIEKFITKNKLFVIGVNASSGIDEKYVNLRTICHPRRFISDSSYLNTIKTPIIMPTKSVPKKLQKLLSVKNKKIFDYGLNLVKKKRIQVFNNFCELSSPLVIMYSLAIAVSGNSKKIFLAGFDGFNKDDQNIDETEHLLSQLFKMNKKILIKTITKSNLKIPHQKI